MKWGGRERGKKKRGMKRQRDIKGEGKRDKGERSERRQERHREMQKRKTKTQRDKEKAGTNANRTDRQIGQTDTQKVHRNPEEGQRCRDIFQIHERCRE